MDELLACSQSLHAFLLRAAEDERCRTPELLKQRVESLATGEVAAALDRTRVRLCSSRPASSEFPQRPWGVDTELSHSEAIHAVIERLLARRRANWEDSNLLTLGYRDAAPGSNGHLVAQSNGVVCFYPNTLVALLKKPQWEEIHHIMGDELFIHLLTHYVILVELPGLRRSFVQIAGKSLRYSLHTGSPAEPTHGKTARDVVSLNEIMYARLARNPHSAYRGPTVLAQVAGKCRGQPTRGDAVRVAKSIFPGTDGKKRLPKRLVNLIPIVQEMVRRASNCDIKMLADRIVPLSPEFRKFMSEYGEVKNLVAERARHRLERDNIALVDPLVLKALDAEYLSQSEEEESHRDRKRKRREEAVEAVSDPAMYAHLHARKPDPKKLRTVQHSKAPGVNSPASNLKKLQEHKSEIKELLSCFTPKRRVYRFVRKLVATIVPKDIWADKSAKSNWVSVKQLLRKLVFARKFDLISLKKCVHELQVINVGWMHRNGKSLCPPNELAARRVLFAQLLQWLITALVFPMLRSLFYITETEGMANEVVYYQRPVWDVISTLALNDLEGGIIVPRDQVMNEFTSQERQLSSSRLRLLPKGTGVRPLINLSAAGTTGTLPVNKLLEKTHQVLTFEVNRHRKRLIGSAVRNIDEIYERIEPLFKEIASCPSCQARREASNDHEPLLYLASVDIERCFDTIRGQKLYRTLKKSLSEEEYLVRKYWVGRQLGSKHLDNGKPSSSAEMLFKMERPAFPAGDLVEFEQLASQSNKRNAVFVDGVVYDYVSRDSVLDILKEHLFSNTIQVGEEEFVQSQGIPQGSVLSTTLCNIYFGQFERRVLRKSLPELCNVPDAATRMTSCHHEALLRYTDDWLFISSNLKRAQRFSQVMHSGNDEFACYVNVAKSQVNFASTIHASVSHSKEVPRFDQPGSSGLLSWCGITIDPVHLQLYVNYDKSSSILVQSSIPLDETKSLHRFFVTKVVSPYRQRWHPLFFDPVLFHQETIQINLFQMLCLMAHRFTLLMDMLPFLNRTMSFFSDSAVGVLKKTTKGIHRSLERAHCSKSDRPYDPDGTMFRQWQQQVFAIGLHCFCLVVRSKMSRRNQQPPATDRWRSLLTLLELEQTVLSSNSRPTSFDWLGKHELNASILQQVL